GTETEPAAGIVTDPIVAPSRGLGGLTPSPGRAVLVAAGVVVAVTTTVVVPVTTAVVVPVADGVLVVVGVTVPVADGVLVAVSVEPTCITNTPPERALAAAARLVPVALGLGVAD